MSRMAGERTVVHVDLRPDGTIDRTSVPTDQATTIVVHRPAVYTSVRPWGEYLTRSVLLLPHADRPHPWAPIMGLLRFLQEHLDHGALLVGHRGASEPEELADLRARALLAFLRDEQAAWVDIASASGRVQDSQAFLEYLHRVRGWDTHVPAITDTANAATARAVEAFQATYNTAFRADIFVDGVIGEQTLGAIFEVAKAEFVQWAELNHTSLDALRFHSSDRPTLAADLEFGGQPWIRLLAIPFAARYDRERAPAGAGIFRVARLLPLPAAEIAAPAFNLLQVRLLDEWGRPLARQAYELTAAGETRFGETDERGVLAEPFMPAGAVTLRLGDGAPVVFHDLYQPREVLELSGESFAPDDDDDEDEDIYDADDRDEVDPDDETWGELMEEDDHAPG
jgi:hypothetical protein